MDQLRRRFLQQGAASAVLLPLLGTGLLRPNQVLAAEWNKSAFAATAVNDSLKLYGTAAPASSKDIIINAPEIAENGAKVEIEISSQIPDTRSLAVFADKNPMPLAASLEFQPNVLPFAKFALKLRESTRLRVVAKTADGKSYVAFREVKVTLGGCGG